jgi:uncharacterized protein (TIGR03067 family)
MLAMLFALSLALPIAEPAKEPELSEAAQKEVKKLAGKWNALSLVVDGGIRKAEGDETEHHFEFKGRKFFLSEMELLGIESLDPGTDQKCIDLKALNDSGIMRQGMVYEGVYKLDGDILVLSIYIGKGKSWPEKFESSEGSAIVVLSMKREKK